jgi:hypothetical protein
MVALAPSRRGWDGFGDFKIDLNRKGTLGRSHFKTRTSESKFATNAGKLLMRKLPTIGLSAKPGQNLSQMEQMWLSIPEVLKKVTLSGTTLNLASASLEYDT